MNRAYESIMTGLTEAVEDVKEKKLPRRVVTVLPVKEYPGRGGQGHQEQDGPLPETVRRLYGGF